MPLTIQRTASVYRLWDDDDLRTCFADHASVGWVCSLVCYQENGQTVWSVRLQNNDTRQLLSIPADDGVVVSDLVTVQTQTLLEYNAANPDNMIEEPGS
jgi:hypothetical protein